MSYLLHYVCSKLDDTADLPPIYLWAVGFEGQCVMNPWGDGYISERIIERNPSGSVVIRGDSFDGGFRKSILDVNTVGNTQYW